AGSFGSRLTGAGWGGCSVHLVRQDGVDAFIAALKQKYYAKHVPHLQGSALDDAVFVTSPGNGAALYILE
ncbi:galactokinase, partial [Coemansia sp. RSA 552]